jgi:hypothetical protein
LCIARYNCASLQVVMYIRWATLITGILLGTMARRALKQGGNTPAGKSWLSAQAIVDTDRETSINRLKKPKTCQVCENLTGLVIALLCFHPRGGRICLELLLEVDLTNTQQ